MDEFLRRVRSLLAPERHVCLVLDGFKRAEVKARTHQNRAQRMQQALSTARRNENKALKFDTQAKLWVSFSANVKIIIIEVSFNECVCKFVCIPR